MQKFLIKLIVLILFLIPLAWSTRVNANYFSTKSFLLYLVGGLCFLYAAFQKKQTPVRWVTQRWLWITYAFIILHLLYSLLFAFPQSLFYLPKVLSLWSIILFLVMIDFDLEQFLRKYEGPVFIFFVILLSFTVQNVLRLITENQSFFSFPSGAIISPFGNINMLAEFYVLCIPLIYLWLRQRTRLNFYLKLILFVLLNGLIFLSKSRSTYLGLGLWWGLVWYDLYFKKHFKWFIGLIAAVLILATVYVQQTGFSLAENKNYSAQERFNFYRSAWDLIVDHPQGIGFQYANQIVPYRLNYPIGPGEDEYPDQPHSEILKWGTQFGWLGLALALLALGLITRHIFKQGSFLLRGVFLVLLPQLLFQFPFENPATILLLALYLYVLMQSLPIKKVTWSWPSKGITASFGVLLIYLACAFIISIYLESNYPRDLTKITQACRLNPTYLRACVMKNYVLLRQQKNDVLKQNLTQDMLRLNYYAADYLKIVSEMVQEKNIESDLVMQDEGLTAMTIYDSADNQSKIMKKVCQIIHVYGFIYKQQLHFPQEDVAACKDYGAPFEFNVAARQFDRSYKEWLTTILK